MKHFIVAMLLGLCGVSTFGSETTQPPAWWVVGPFACYSTADFEANEAIENARNSELTATWPVRWFLNKKLVAKSKEAGVQKTPMNLSAGMNCLLAKSWVGRRIRSKNEIAL